jgi:hypothetical protein
MPAVQIVPIRAHAGMFKSHYSGDALAGCGESQYNQRQLFCRPLANLADDS